MSVETLGVFLPLSVSVEILGSSYHGLCLLEFWGSSYHGLPVSILFLIREDHPALVEEIAYLTISVDLHMYGDCHRYKSCYAPLGQLHSIFKNLSHWFNFLCFMSVPRKVMLNKKINMHTHKK